MFRTCLILALTATPAFAGHCQKSRSHEQQAAASHHEMTWTVAHHAEATAAPDIVDTAVASEDFNTLVALVKTAGLVDALKGEGPLTVFAPTDEAFAKLPKETVEFLLSPEGKEKLTQILTYHVVAGRVTSDQVVRLNSAETLQGQDIAIKVVDGKVNINDSQVVAVDVEASNGVIHVIDTVLIPQD